jgi:hypothetical protein
MPAPPVAGAEFKFVGYQQCEYCDGMDPCYSLVPDQSPGRYPGREEGKKEKHQQNRSEERTCLR